MQTMETKTLTRKQKVLTTSIFIILLTTMTLFLTVWKPKTVKISAELGNEQSKLEYIHLMTNTLITSKHIWGTEKITIDNIEVALKYAYELDKPVIVEYLEEWKKGNFDNSVEFHNYVWNLLGGTVGRATGLNYREVDNAEKTYRE